MTSAVVAAVLGSPISQSLSPTIHEAAFRAAGRPGRYIAVECGVDGFVAAVERLRMDGAIGVSVTMPCKEVAARSCDSLHPVAAVLGAVNCIHFSREGIVGYNTDGDGCCDALVEQGGVEPGTARAVVLGAGGAARSVALALLRRGADVLIVNRTVSRAEAAVDSLGGQSGSGGTLAVGSMADIPGADLLINTTSVGMGADESPVDAELLHSRLTVLDAVYHPLDTRLMRDARAAGAATVDGLWMLIHQARRQQEVWFGSRPDPAPMRTESERVLRERSN